MAMPEKKAQFSTRIGANHRRGAYGNRSFRWMKLRGRVRLSARIVVFLVLLPAMLFAGTRQEPSLEELAAQFRAYRVALERDTERQRPELRDWSGPVHRLMSDVGRRIEDGRYRVAEVYRLIGRPDKIVRGGESYVGTPVPSDETHLVYWWRGGHDYMYLVVKRGRVARSCWWYAGE